MAGTEGAAYPFWSADSRSIGFFASNRLYRLDINGGPPRLRFHGGAARRFAEMSAGSSLLTITHTDDLAMAQVMILGG